MPRINPPGVNSFRDRAGRLRYYYRRRGRKAVPLPGSPSTPEFEAAYEAAKAGAAPLAVSKRAAPGTIDALAIAYYRSEEWSLLADETRKTRKRIIERFRAEHGSKRVATLRHEHVQAMLARVKKLTAKRHWLKAIRPLLRSAIPTMRKDDPTEGIANIKLPKTKGHATWSDAEIAQYRAHWPLGTQQRLVMEFALETFSRRGEVVRLGPQHVRGGRIRIERTHGSQDVDIPVTPELKAACDAMPKAHLTFIVTLQGKPRSKYGLGNHFAKWATEAGLPARCRLHGLKKGGMRRLAEAGNTAHELMALSGHRTLTEVQRYTIDAEKKRLADSGMAKMQGQKENASVTNITPLELQTDVKSNT